jgi:hypothetical protein
LLLLFLKNQEDPKQSKWQQAGQLKPRTLLPGSVIKLAGFSSSEWAAAMMQGQASPGKASCVADAGAVPASPPLCPP